MDYTWVIAVSGDDLLIGNVANHRLDGRQGDVRFLKRVEHD